MQSSTIIESTATESIEQLINRMPRDYNTAAELGAVFTFMGIKKAKSPLDKIVFLGCLAGFFVFIAGTFAVHLMGGIPTEIRMAWPLIPKLMVGCSFPIGLVFILLFGGELFTGNTMIMLIAYFSRKIRVRDIAINWTLAFTSNLLSILFFTYLLAYQTDMFALPVYQEYIIAVAEKKANLSFVKAFLLGIPGLVYCFLMILLANSLVCLAFFLGLSARDMTGKIFGMYLPIFAFAACGWEHCIANMFFISLGWMYGADISLASFSLNIFSVSLGNIAGGGLMIGGSQYILHNWYRETKNAIAAIVENVGKEVETIQKVQQIC